MLWAIIIGILMILFGAAFYLAGFSVNIETVLQQQVLATRQLADAILVVGGLIIVALGSLNRNFSRESDISYNNLAGNLELILGELRSINKVLKSDERKPQTQIESKSALTA